MLSFGFKATFNGIYRILLTLLSVHSQWYTEYHIMVMESNPGFQFACMCSNFWTLSDHGALFRYIPYLLWVITVLLSLLLNHHESQNCFLENFRHTNVPIPVSSLMPISPHQCPQFPSFPHMCLGQTCFPFLLFIGTVVCNTATLSPGLWVF